MPIDRIRAPRAYPSAAAVAAAPGGPAGGGAGETGAVEEALATQADQEHGPRERRARLDDLAVALEQRDERALGPVVEGAGGVAEVAQVGAARHVERAPQRLARDGHEQPSRRDPCHLRDRVLGVRHVLE